MSARSSLHPVQFRREPDDDYDKVGEYDAKGADEDTNFGYSAENAGDYQYNREMTGNGARETAHKREVF